MTPQEESRRAGRLRLFAIREQHEAIGERMAQDAARFHALERKESAARAVVADQLFQTPATLAARLVELATAGGRPLGRCLEPSAGLGRIYREIRRNGSAASITLVEIAPACAAELYRETDGHESTRLVQGDFLTMDARRLGEQDTVVMNPPFTMRSDIRHIEHAAGLLADGGLLVAVCMSGQPRRRAFGRDGWRWIDLPAGSFRQEGTGVDTAVVIYQKGKSGS